MYIVEFIAYDNSYLNYRIEELDADADFTGWLVSIFSCIFRSYLSTFLYILIYIQGGPKKSL